MLLGIEGLLCTSTTEIPIYESSLGLIATFANRLAILLFYLSIQVIPNASKASISSQTTFIYYFNLLFFEAYEVLICFTTSFESPIT